MNLQEASCIVRHGLTILHEGCTNSKTRTLHERCTNVPLTLHELKNETLCTRANTATRVVEPADRNNILEHGVKL